MAQSPPTQIPLATDESDLRQNRLGLMSQRQIDQLQAHIDYHQSRFGQLIQRTLLTGVVITIGVVIAVLIRLLIVPVAVVIEAVIVGGMIYLTTDFNRFVQHLLMDKEARAVRIIKGRTSRYTMRNHPLYQTVRVELQNYKVLDSALYQQLDNGELYQLYVLPQSRTVVAAEKLETTKSGYLI